MSRIKWCRNCCENVYPYKKFSVLAFVFTLFVPYLLYFLLLKRRECPFCGSRDLGRRRVIASKRKR